MSGHSKWSTIKRQKGITDAKRGQAFTKVSNAITIAVKQGGGIVDPNSNFKLRLAIDKAREVNMPKDNVDRAIKRAEGKDAGAVEEIQYEGFGPGGTAFLIETVTDNRQRTFSEVRNIVSKNGGNLGEPGSVSYMFDKIGEIVIKKDNSSFDELFTIGLEIGVDDVEEEGELVFFYCDPSLLFEMRQKLEEKNIKVENSEIVYKPKSSVELDDALAQKVLLIVERLDELDDVQQVFHNLA